MRFRDFLSSAIFDLLLCAVLSATFMLVAGSGFHFDALRQNFVLVGGACLVLSAILVLGTYGKRFAIGCGVSYVVVALAACGLALSTTEGPDALADAEGNRVVFVVVLALVCLVVFGLSRRKATAALLAVLGVFAMAAAQFLFAPDLPVAYVIFIVAAVANCMFRFYMGSLKNSESERTAFGSMTAAAAAMGVIAVALAAGAWFAIVAPLNPPAQELVLIVIQRAQPEVEVQGTTSVQQLLRDTMSNQDPSQETLSDNPEDNGEQESDEPDEGQQENDDAASGSSGLDMRAVFYELLLPAVPLALLLVVVLVAAAVALKLHLRRRRLARIQALEPRGQLVAFTRFFEQRLARMGIVRPPSFTLREFAIRAESTLHSFEEGGGVQADENTACFSSILEAAQRCAYGTDDPTPQEIEACKSYYASFYKRCRNYIGTPRYLLKWWRL